MISLKSHRPPLRGFFPFLLGSYAALMFPTTPWSSPALRKLDGEILMQIALCAALSVFIFAGLMPHVASAATSYSFGPPQQLQQSFSTAGNSWWNTIAVPGFWISLIAGVVLYVSGLTQYLRWAFIGIFLFAFGAQVGKFIMSLGGHTIT